MSKRDYYEVLGVERQADERALKRAYRALARKYHPDSNPDPEAAGLFKEATEAYGVLNDPDKRARYDAGGHDAVDGRGFDPGAFTDFGDLFGVFGQLFGGDAFGGGGRRRGNRPSRGDDLLHELEIEFEEAALGTERELEFSRLAHCEDCDGKGAADGSSHVTCEDCGGRGQVVVRQGIFSLGRPCPSCSGSGRVLENPCDSCDGAGRREAERKVKLKVPAGVEHGQRIRVPGAGEDGLLGGPAGDLYVRLHVAEHDIFEREGADLHLRLPLSFPQVALGAEVSVPTLGDDLKVKIPAATESGDVIRMRGKGVARLGSSGFGDLYLHVALRTPKRLNSKQKKLLQQYAQATDEDYAPGPQEKSLVDRVKDIFG